MMRPLPLAIAALLLASTTLAQPETVTDPREAERRAITAIESGDNRAAAAWFIRQTQLEPDNFAPFYNLACAVSLMGDAENAGPLLARAVELGFTNYHLLTTDPQLETARTSPEYQTITSNWPAILEARATANTEATLKQLGPSYTATRDQNLRVIYIAACHPATLAIAQADLTATAKWAEQFFGEPDNKKDNDIPDAWVTVMLLEPPEFQTWSLKNFGIADTFSTVAGRYAHDRKQLVAKSIGGTLRHEFFHALHHRHMDRLNQAHPVWIQEGLAALVEDIDTPEDAGNDHTLVPVPSWRSNVTRNLASANRLPKLETLASMTHTEFSTKRPLANYAISRDRMLYLSQQNALATFYAELVRTFDTDPTGQAAYEHAQTEALSETQTFRDWARALPKITDPNDGTPSRVGAEFDPGTGDGPRVTRTTRKAASAGLRPNDTVIAINDQPTRDIHELARRLGAALETRDPLRLTVRRPKGEATVTINAAR